MRRRWYSPLLVILALTLAPIAYGGATDGKLDVYWNDTEGGASTLIVTPAGESILIDTGNAGGRDAKRIFETASRAAGLKQIDYLILTHNHGDHFGGAAELAAMMPIRIVCDNGVFPGGFERPSKPYLEFKCEQRRVLNPGDLLPLKQADGAPKVSIRCLAARKQFIPPPADAKPNPDCEGVKKKPDDPSDNANSIVNLLSFGDFCLFDGGDLTWNMEAKLVCPVNLVGTVDVFQIDHHGLDVSNNPALVKSLKPKVVIVNNGPKKGCGPEMFATIKATESVVGIYQVHKNLRPDGAKVNVPDEFIANQKDTPDCEGHGVRLSVDPSAKTYTVSVPSTKHEQKYVVGGGLAVGATPASPR